jgi:hypothetical protein
MDFMYLKPENLFLIPQIRRSKILTSSATSLSQMEALGKYGGSQYRTNTHSLPRRLSPMNVALHSHYASGSAHSPSSAIPASGVYSREHAPSVVRAMSRALNPGEEGEGLGYC